VDYVGSALCSPFYFLNSAVTSTIVISIASSYINVPTPPTIPIVGISCRDDSLRDVVWFGMVGFTVSRKC
jgi:hypothetical protein